MTSHIHVHAGIRIDTPERARRHAHDEALGVMGLTAGVIGLCTVPMPVTIIAALVLHDAFGNLAVLILVTALILVVPASGALAYRAARKHLEGPCR